MHITFVALGWEQLGVSQLSAIAKEKHNLFHLYRSLAHKLGLKTPPATRMKENISFQLSYSKQKPEKTAETKVQAEKIEELAIANN